MEIGMVGLGKMGGNMSRRLSRDGHRVVGYTQSFEDADALAQDEENVLAAKSLEELAQKLSAPRAVWSMVPAGAPTESVIDGLIEVLQPGDVIIDGGNSNYHDTLSRAEVIRDHDMHFVDVGVSGGIWGLKEGYGMMIGGEAEVVSRLRPIFESLAPAVDKGWERVGPNGAGHFVKMVHNGIEYGIMQAYAEGFEIMKSKGEFDLDVYKVAEAWRYGTVIRSWLLDLIAEGLKEDQELDDVRGWVEDSGEGRWTVFEAIDQDIPAPVITLSLMMRLVSRQEESYAAKLLAVLRNQFGGHAVKEER
ncbi:MAG TPA: decarboxylating 6-phosphogluconate dehydrogenase [Anaerolineales bacterium]